MQQKLTVVIGTIIKGYLKKWRDVKVGTYLPDTFGDYAGKKYCGAF